jgi:DNA-binding transcriptional LysR family regulator
MNRDIMNAISSCEYKKRFIKTDIETIITLVSSNTGFTILPKKSIKDNHKDIIIIPFEHDTSFDLFLVWNKNRNFKPINDFIHYMKNKIDYL